MSSSYVDFDKYLEEQLSDSTKKKYFDNKKIELDSAYAVFKERERLGLSQNQLSQLSNVPQATISRIEAGNNVNLETLNKIANAFGKKVKVSFV